MILGLYSDAACSTLGSYSPTIWNGTGVYSTSLLTYYTVARISSTEVSYSFGCTNISCSDCSISGTTNYNTCVSLGISRGSNVYGKPWQVSGKSVNVTVYSNSECTAIASASANMNVASGSCGFSNFLSTYFVVSETTTGNFVAGYQCDSSCYGCSVYGDYASVNACVPTGGYWTSGQLISNTISSDTASPSTVIHTSPNTIINTTPNTTPSVSPNTGHASSSSVTTIFLSVLLMVCVMFLGCL